ncbi:putative ADP-ribosylation factor-like protein [Naja naja]|nr:putative ADP-ribosylation factor-like protein [Naja naja]
MGLLSILKKMRQKEQELRLLMLGLDNAGKTTILKKFNGDEIDTICSWASTSRPWSTAGEDATSLSSSSLPGPFGLALPPLPCLSAPHRFKLNIWDVGARNPSLLLALF